MSSWFSLFELSGHYRLSKNFENNWISKFQTLQDSHVMKTGQRAEKAQIWIHKASVRSQNSGNESTLAAREASYVRYSFWTLQEKPAAGKSWSDPFQKCSLPMNIVVIPVQSLSETNSMKMFSGSKTNFLSEKENVTQTEFPCFLSHSVMFEVLVVRLVVLGKLRLGGQSRPAST